MKYWVPGNDYVSIIPAQDLVNYNLYENLNDTSYTYSTQYKFLSSCMLMDIMFPTDEDLNEFMAALQHVADVLGVTIPRRVRHFYAAAVEPAPSDWDEAYEDDYGVITDQELIDLYTGADGSNYN